MMTAIILLALAPFLAGVLLLGHMATPIHLIACAEIAAACSTSATKAAVDITHGDIRTYPGAPFRNDKICTCVPRPVMSAEAMGRNYGTDVLTHTVCGGTFSLSALRRDIFRASLNKETS